MRGRGEVRGVVEGGEDCGVAPDLVQVWSLMDRLIMVMISGFEGRSIHHETFNDNII